MVGISYPPPSLPFLREKGNDGEELLCANVFVGFFPTISRQVKVNKFPLVFWLNEMVLFSDLSPPLNYMTLCGWYACEDWCLCASVMKCWSKMIAEMIAVIVLMHNVLRTVI